MTADNAALEQDILEMLRPLCGRNEKITAETSINHDLSIDGDDADIFLLSVQKRYGTSFDTFDFHTYFANEYVALWQHWRRKLGLSDGKTPLTVRHLAAVVRRGSWFPPPRL